MHSDPVHIHLSIRTWHHVSSSTVHFTLLCCVVLSCILAVILVLFGDVLGCGFDDVDTPRSGEQPAASQSSDEQQPAGGKSC